jgi:hypothetical protein
VTVRIMLPGPVLATRQGTREKLAPALSAIEEGQFVLLDFSAVEASAIGALDEVYKTPPSGKWNAVGMNKYDAEAWVRVVGRRESR